MNEKRPRSGCCWVNSHSLEGAWPLGGGGGDMHCGTSGKDEGPHSGSQEAGPGYFTVSSPGRDRTGAEVSGM